MDKFDKSESTISVGQGTSDHKFAAAVDMSVRHVTANTLDGTGNVAPIGELLEIPVAPYDGPVRPGAGNDQAAPPAINVQTRSPSNIEKSAEGVMHVADDVVTGCVNELLNHPGTILTDVATGAILTAAGSLLLPEGLAGLAIVGGAAAIGGSYEIIKTGGVRNAVTDLVHQAESIGHSVIVDYDRGSYSAADQQKAETAIKKVGAFGLNALALGALRVVGIKITPPLRE